MRSVRENTIGGGSSQLFEMGMLVRKFQWKLEEVQIWAWLGSISNSKRPGEGGGVLPYNIGSTGMCRWRGYDFQAIWSGIGSNNHRKVV